MRFTVELSADEIREALVQKACEKLALSGKYTVSVTIDEFTNGTTRAVVTMEQK